MGLGERDIEDATEPLIMMLPHCTEQIHHASYEYLKKAKSYYVANKWRKVSHLPVISRELSRMKRELGDWV